jgi:transposase
MTRFVGLDVSQKITAICVVDDAGRRLWRGQCPTNPEQISILVRRHAGDDARIGIETGAMTPWLVHELRWAYPGRARCGIGFHRHAH